MGGASKFLMLLTTPSPFLCPRPSALRLARHSRVCLSFSPKRRFSSSSRPRLGVSINASEQIHTHTNASLTRDDFQYGDSLGFPPNSRVSHPWPEWSKIVDNLSAAGYFDRQRSSSVNAEDAFSVFEDLPVEFVEAATACLSFARDRSDLLGSLSRKDIELVVENGSPFLFKSAVDSARRMRSFLNSKGSNELDFERARTVDLMRFLVSYACNPPAASDGNSVNNRELVESSVRNLLTELADASRTVRELDLSGSMPKQFPDRYGQTPRPLGQNIEMKRGDWLCPKCSFMNFARNMKCLECNEARPKRQLTGGEWECPQCDFFNYGRNVVCLRCDCKRPGEASFDTAGPRSGLRYNNGSNLRMGNDGISEGNGFQAGDGVGSAKTSDSSISQSLDRILGRSSSVSEKDNSVTAAREINTGKERSSISSSTSPQYRRSEGSNAGYVPFVPLPTDMFAKPQESKMEEEQEVTGKYNPVAAKDDELMGSSVSGKSGDSLLLSGKPVNQTESKEDKEQAEKSERWFKKVAELHDVTDLASAISDEDFPEIMPMRKGENRFVVSKKKDRSLTSPLHKRRMAMEQSNSSNFVPFVPFPPDYFAKKDKQPETGASTEKSTDRTNAAAAATPEIQGVPEKSEEQKARVPSHGAAGNSVQWQKNQQTDRESWNTGFSGKSLNKSEVDSVYGGPSRNSTQRPDDSRIGNRESWTSGSLKETSRSDAASLTGSSTQQPENPQNSRENWNRGFSGKSLEGSLVKEPDPLDMSEEAKAERWFRRAAQIKDISELSQIPDEDFPEIMPMRKGVNRFVVSKRKTPLERRLTSPQYRRNLPIVSSEPVKKENDAS